jgi:hypothetical protein
MSTETRRTARAVRRYTEGEIKTLVRQMKIDGALLEDCEAELHILADFVRGIAEELRSAWPVLLEEGGFAKALARLQEPIASAEFMEGVEELPVQHRVVQEVLQAFGPMDPRKIAAWFNAPNGWIFRRRTEARRTQRRARSTRGSPQRSQKMALELRGLRGGICQKKPGTSHQRCAISWKVRSIPLFAR